MIRFINKGPKLFGTDGIRGMANDWPITPDVLVKIGMTSGAYFYRDRADSDHRPTVVIGKDTRLSGYLIESALTAGFLSVGMDVVLLGPLPTPGVALMTRSLRADLGVMISASHNPYHDNGIKFFGSDGYKLLESQEKDIEEQVLSGPLSPSILSCATTIGKARRLDDALGRYLEFVKSSFPRDLRLDGLKIVVDCAHGAAYKIAPSLLWELGAKVISIGVDPNGLNINQGCGATDLDFLRSTVIEHGADLGLAFDGDADRLMVVDEKGHVIDGDQILALLAKSWQEQGKLLKNTVVATQMSNLGLEKFLHSLGIDLLRTDIGDKYVSKAMKEHKLNLGGEQSGHLILGDYSTTGDGVCAALQVLSIIARTRQPASKVLNLFEPAHQLTRSIPLKGDNAAKTSLVDHLQEQVEKLGKDDLHVLVRPSGTEPKIRLMVQGLIQESVEAVIDHLTQATYHFLQDIDQPSTIKHARVR